MLVHAYYSCVLLNANLDMRFVCNFGLVDPFHGCRSLSHVLVDTFLHVIAFFFYRS